MLNRIDLRGSTDDPRRLLPRAALDVSAAVEAMRPVVEAVRDHGASAVRDATRGFQAGIRGIDVGPALAIPGVALIMLAALPTAFLLVTLSARYRDLQQMIASIVQLAFFMTPIFWHRNLLGEHTYLADFNPFAQNLVVGGSQ